MATTTLNATCRHEQPLMRRMQRHLRAAIDTFVTSRMQEVASKADYLRAKGSRCGLDESCARTSDHAESPGVELQPLDEDILSAAIPAFFIGRNRAGLWVSREATGRIGGIFLFKSSALAFARAQSQTARCALVLPSARFELDLENNGNPFARYAEPLIRIATSCKRFGGCALIAGLAVGGLAGTIALQATIYVYVWRLPV